MKIYPTKFKSFQRKIVQMGALQKLQNFIQTLIIFWPVYSIDTNSLFWLTFVELPFCHFPPPNNSIRGKDSQIYLSSFSNKRKTTKLFPSPLTFLEWPMLVFRGRTSTWRPHTGLCKFVQNVSTNIWILGKRTNLKLGEVSSLLIFYNITISWLYPLNGFRIIFHCVWIAWQYKHGLSGVRWRHILSRINQIWLCNFPNWQFLSSAPIKRYDYSMLIGVVDLHFQGAHSVPTCLTHTQLLALAKFYSGESYLFNSSICLRSYG